MSSPGARGPREHDEEAGPEPWGVGEGEPRGPRDAPGAGAGAHDSGGLAFELDPIARRAANAVWLGSGDYALDRRWVEFARRQGPGHAGGPATGATNAGDAAGSTMPTGAVGPADASDAALYVELMCGAAARWFGADELLGLADTWAQDVRTSQLDRVLWLVVEGVTYALEAPTRPALAELRAAFLSGLSREDRRVVERAGAAAAAVGDFGHGKSPYLGAGDARMPEEDAPAPGPAPAPASAPGPAPDPASASRSPLPFAPVAELVRRVARECCGFDGRVVRAADRRVHLGVSYLATALRRNLEKRGGPRFALSASGEARMRRDGAASSRGTSGAGPGDTGATETARRRESRAERQARRDRAYIENCFGRPVCSSERLEAIERATCTGIHRACHVWIADGSQAPGGGGGREFARLLAEGQAAYERNRSFYEERRTLFRGAEDRLAQQLADRLRGEGRLHVHGQRAGRLDTGRAWRAELLDDPRLFELRPRADTPPVQVDLVLDASGSRSDAQQAVAAQARVVAGALVRAGCTVRVLSFCSVRGYTVLRLFGGLAGVRGGGETVALDSVLRYCAGGMNRDGLALRAVGELGWLEGARQRLVIVLTDGAPLDDAKVAPTAPDGTPTAGPARDYVGRLAVDDTARAVRELEHAGIRVAAIFYGEDDLVGWARQIYGAGFSRVRSLARLADIAGEAILSALERG